MRKFLLIPFLIFFCSITFAQESENYKIPNSTFNEGGNWRNNGTYSIENDAIGNAVLGEMCSTNYCISSNSPYHLEPKEIENLLLEKGEEQVIAILTWKPEPTANTYNVYREFIATLMPGYYPNCLQNGETAPTYTDSDMPNPGEGYYYLVTGKNAYGESILGRDSNEKNRLNNSPCP